MIPKDPNILLCVINTKLRDKYKSLVELCSDLSISYQEIICTLEDIGYYYNEQENQFKAKTTR